MVRVRPLNALEKSKGKSFKRSIPSASQRAALI